MPARKPAAQPADGAAGVEAYLADLPVAQAEALRALRATILAAAPKATERISYRIPTFFHEGALVAMAAFPKHLSLITMRPGLLEAHAKELEGLDWSGSTLRFAPEAPLPKTLVKRLVKARLRENAEAAASKAKKGKGAPAARRRAAA